MSYIVFAYKMFGGIVNSIKNNFNDIKDDLHKSGLNYTLEEYLSEALLTTFITFFSILLILSFVLGIILENIAISLVLALLCSLGASGVLFFLFYTYPSAVAKNKEAKIRKILPFAVSYMSTIASSKVPTLVIFKTLSKFKEYGEVAEEAGNITKDVEIAGMNLSYAVKKQAKRTASGEFRDLLWGVNTVMQSGGDMHIYLSQKNEEFMNTYRRAIRKYAADLSLYVEVYLTLIITGSIFFIVLSSIISAISGGTETVAIQSFVVFILLPLMSIGFILMVKSLSPTEG